ncbi:MAG: tetratricopeptide repeat protein [Methylophilaceae bacterium]
MIKEVTLSILISSLYINNIYAYDVNNECEKLLNKRDYNRAIEVAERVDNPYDSNFCLGKAYYRQKNYGKAIESFNISAKEASHPADQMQAILFKGISERDNHKLDISTKTFKYGFETAKLGNTKYLQYEQRFLYQIGKNTLLLKEYFEATEYFARSIRVASNDEERALSYDGLAQAYYYYNKSGKAVEYGLKASMLYQKVGMLGEYADSVIELSRYFYLDKKPNKGIDILEKLERFCIDNGGEYFLAKTLLALSSLLEKQGDKAGAADKQQKANIIIDRLGITDLE